MMEGSDHDLTVRRNPNCTSLVQYIITMLDGSPMTLCNNINVMQTQ